MDCAISTACLYPLETEKSLAKLLDLGFRQFEIFTNCESEFSGEFIKEIENLLKPHDAHVYSVHLYTSGLEPFMFFSNYPRRFRDSVAQYARYFEKAAQLGAKVVVFHGDRKDGNLSVEDFCDRFAALSDVAKRDGVILAQENVSRCRSATLESVSTMKKLLGNNIKFVLDIKQALRAGVSPLDMCDAMGENIACVHLSDSSEQSDCLLPGSGSFDLSSLILKLRKYCYTGPLIIEIYNSGFKEYSELVSSKNHILTKLKT
jgi:sugar phosphate isomerase/epimerase